MSDRNSSPPALSPFAGYDRAIAILVRADGYARRHQVDCWEFAVEAAELLAAGLSIVDLRWLVHSGLADHARESTLPGASTRGFSQLSRTAVSRESCFVLTELGRTLLAEPHEAQQRPRPESSPAPQPHRHATIPEADTQEHDATLLPSPAKFVPSHSMPEAPPMASSPAPLGAKVKPEWDPNLRELRYQDILIKRFRVPAANQELILTAFEEDSWPDWIDDPLPPVSGIDPKRRLQATIKSLNRNQAQPLLRFHGNGCGRIVCWEPAD